MVSTAYPKGIAHLATISEIYSCFENHCYFSSLFCCLGLSKCDKAARLYCVYFIHSSAYIQIYCCETQTSCQTTTAATAKKLIRKFCKVKLFAKCKREISKQEMSSYLWRLSSSFLPYMSSLRDNERRRGGLGLNNRVKDVVCLLLMTMINDDTSKTDEDNVKINYRVNNNIFCALRYLISHVFFHLLSSVAHNSSSSSAYKSSSTI